MELLYGGRTKNLTGRVPEDIEKTWWPDFYYFHSLNWWRWHIERTKLFDGVTGDDMDGDGIRITKQWAKIMEKKDELHNNQLMRWNRIVARRNSAQAQDFRV